MRVVTVSSEAWSPWTPAQDAAMTPRLLFEIEIDRARRLLRAGTHVRLAGFASDGALIGLFALNEIVRGVFRSAYASWQVSADRTNRGFGTEAVGALLDLAFRGPPHGAGLHRVQANIMPANTPSLRIAEKVGFRREGYAERYLEIAGSWEDHVMLAITSEEWEAEASAVEDGHPGGVKPPRLASRWKPPSR